MIPGMESVHAESREFLPKIIGLDGALRFGVVSPTGDVLLAACVNEATAKTCCVALGAEYAAHFARCRERAQGPRKPRRSRKSSA